MKYDDLHELGSETAVRAAGKYLMKGREYEVLDGDIMYVATLLNASSFKGLRNILLIPAFMAVCIGTLRLETHEKSKCSQY